MSVTCATIAAALMAALPGQTVTLAPGSDCGPVTVRARQWAVPVTLVATGATIRHLTLHDVGGFRVLGGTFLPTDPMASDLRGRGVTVRGNSERLAFLHGTYIRCGKCLVIGQARDVVIEHNLFEPRQDGVALAAAHRVTVRFNSFRNFNPRPTQCRLPAVVTYPPGASPVVIAGAVVPGLSRRACEARGGAWADGDHADAVQVFGLLSTDILIEQNETVGAAQCYGMFKQVQDRGLRVRIRNNYCETSARHAVLIEDCTDCEATGNVGRRHGGTPNRVQMRAINSTGRFCGNDNPDAPRDSVLVRPC